MTSLNKLVKAWKKDTAIYKTKSNEIFHVKDHSLLKYFNADRKPEQLFAGEKIFKNSKNAYACVKQIDDRSVFFKKVHHNNRPFLHLLRYNFVPSRGYNNAVISELLRASKIPTPEIYVCGEYRKRNLLQSSFMVADAVDGKNLTEVIPCICKKEDLTLVFLAHWGAFINRLHSVGVFHSDAKLSNFYVVNNDMDLTSAETWSRTNNILGVWDLDSAKFFEGGVPEKYRIKDAARAISSFLIKTEQYNSDAASLNPTAENLIHQFCTHAQIDSKAVLKELRRRWQCKLGIYRL